MCLPVGRELKHEDNRIHSVFCAYVYMCLPVGRELKHISFTRFIDLLPHGVYMCLPVGRELKHTSSDLERLFRQNSCLHVPSRWEGIETDKTCGR